MTKGGLIVANRPVQSGTPSKNRENQDSATMSQSQPATSEEVQARAGTPATATPTGEAEPHHSPGSGGPTRVQGDPLDQSERASDEDVTKRARSHN